MRLNRRHIFECLIGVACIIVVAVVALFPMVSGHIPTNVDSTLFLAPWEDARPLGMEPPTNPASELAADRYYPWRVFLSQCGQARQSFLWNPYESCGLPFFALWRSRCLSPFSLPFYVMPLHRAIQISALLKLIVAGLCAFVMARRFGLAWATSLFVGISYELSGPVLTQLDMPLSDSLPWLPLLVLCVGHLGLGQHKIWPLGSFVLTLMLLGGEPEAVVTAVLLCSCFLLVQMLLMRRTVETRRNRPLRLLIMIVSAVGLAAVQLLPWFEYIVHAVRPSIAEPSGLAATDLVACFFPRFLGPVSAQVSAGGHAAPFLYVGIVPLLLLPLWFSLRSFPPIVRRYRVEALLASAAMMTLLGFAVGRVAPHCPGLGCFSPLHFLLGNALAVALAAAESADEWIVLDPDGCRVTLKRLCVFGAVPVFAATMLALARYHADRAEAIPFQFQALVLGLFALGLFALLTITLLRPSIRLLGYGLSVLVFVDLFLVFHHCIPFAEPDLLFPSTRFVKALQAAEARVTGTEALARWPLAGNLIRQTYGTSGMQLRRHQAYVEQVQKDPLLLRRMGSRILLLTKQDIQGPFARVRASLAVDEVFSAGAVMFHDLSSRERAWMAYESQEVKAFDPSLLGPEAPPQVEQIVPPPDDPGPAAKTTITSETHTQVRVEVEQTRPGILVLADTFYPGWKATVDGKAAQVFPVDGFARGVLLGQGSHEVVFYYAPATLSLGLIISAITAILLSICSIRFLQGYLRERDPWR